MRIQAINQIQTLKDYSQINQTKTAATGKWSISHTAGRKMQTVI